MTNEELKKILREWISLLGTDGKDTKGIVKKEMEKLLKSLK